MNYKNCRSLLLIAVLISPLLFTSLGAQLGGAAIFGSVTDESGGVIPGADVNATNVGTNKINATVTGNGGFYEFPLLPLGDYVVTVEIPGFRKAVSGTIILESGTRPRIDFQLEVGAVTEEVEVVATTPLINRSNPQLGIVVDEKTTKELPLNGRSFFDMINLQPGVIASNAEPGSGSGTGSLSGQRGGVEFYGAPGYGNNWLLDGVDMSFGENNAAGDQAAGTGGNGAVINTISIEAISELKTTGSSFSAEYGRATGAVINISTKSGTNDFHGTAFYFFRRDRFNANNFFSNANGVPRPDLKHDQYGGNIGGPVVKDRAFFFFNIENAKLDRGRSVSGNRLTDEVIANNLGIDSATLVDPEIGRIRHATPNPMLADLYRQLTPANCSPTSDPRVCFHARNAAANNDEKTYLWRGDVELTDTQHFQARYSFNNQDFITPNFTEFEGHTRQFPTRFRNLAVQHNYTLSPRVINEFRFGINSNQLTRLQGALRGSFPAGGGSARSAGLTNIDGQCIINFKTKTYTLADNFSWVRDRHHLKFGFEARKMDSKRIIAENPIVRYASVDDLLFERDPLYLQIWFGFPDGFDGFEHWQTGWYVNDDWRVSDRVQLNLGLRYEYYTGFVGPWNIAGSDIFGAFIPNRETPIFDPDKNNFAPRLGMVIDLDDEGTTVLRLGGAVTYTPPQPFYYFDMAFLPDPTFPSFAQFAPVDIPAAFQPIRFPFPFEFQEAVIDGLKSGDLSQIPASILELPSTPSPAERDRADEYASHWNMSLERQMTPWLGATASYVGSAGNKLLTNFFPNLIDPATGQRGRPDFGPILMRLSDGRTDYHSMHLSLRGRRDDLTFLTSFVLAKAHTYHSVDAGFGTGDRFTQDFSNIAGSYGPKSSDTRRRFMGNWIYTLPGGASDSAARFLTNGWNLSGIMGWRSAYPINVISGFDTRGDGLGFGKRPNRTGANVQLTGPDKLAWLNPAAFCFPTPGGGCTASGQAETNGSFGDVGLFSERGPSAFWLDFGLTKDFNFKESHRLQFRWEMFNVLNHAVLRNPAGFGGAALTSSTFGRITGAADGRSMQFALKYIF